MGAGPGGNFTGGTSNFNGSFSSSSSYSCKSNDFVCRQLYENNSPCNPNDILCSGIYGNNTSHHDSVRRIVDVHNSIRDGVPYEGSDSSLTDQHILSVQNTIAQQQKARDLFIRSEYQTLNTICADMNYNIGMSPKTSFIMSTFKVAPACDIEISNGTITIGSDVCKAEDIETIIIHNNNIEDCASGKIGCCINVLINNLRNTNLKYHCAP